MLSKFFIDRPVLAWVIAILIMLCGAVVLPRLEISRYPNIAPPSVSVSLSYPGASALTLENTVAQVVEQQMTGLDNLLYFSSRSNSEGSLFMSFTFDAGMDPDVAQMQIQNRLDSIMTKLPSAVQRNGARVRKVSDDTLQRIAFYARDGSLAQEDVADFIASVIQDPISRVNGVGNVTLNGSEYAIRIWLDQEKLFAFRLNPEDIVRAIESQNKQVSVGQMGGLPSVDGQPINVNVQSRRLLEHLDDFANILVKVDEDGGAVYLKDVALIEMGRSNYTYFGNYNGRPMAALSIDLTEGANAVETAERVAAKLKELEPLFPDNLTYAFSYDTVPFVKASLQEVTKTLIEALILVSMVILLFLRDLRSTLIVSLTIPVVLSGTLTVLLLFGYSINTLTMFAMVLAIGLLVDDAIVVVENVNRLMETEHLSPREAAVTGMQEISSALFGVGIVIAAVFAPMSFFSGATGNIYRQFSVTIVSAMLLSIAVALIITPSLCAQLLRDRSQKAANAKGKGRGTGQGRAGAQGAQAVFVPQVHENTVRLTETGAGGHGQLPVPSEGSHKPKGCVSRMLGLFDRSFVALQHLYLRIVRASLHYRGRTFVCWLLVCAAGAGLFLYIPTSFIPSEDQSLISARIVLPVGATQERTQKVALEVEDFFMLNEKDNVEGFMLTLGSAGRSSGQATASGSIRLKPWEERKGEENTAFAILDRAKRHFENYSDASISFYMPGSIRGLGSSSGFQVNVLNSSGNSHEQFLNDIRDLVDKANQSLYLYNVRYEIMEDAPQLQINIDDLRAGQFNLDSDTVNSNLEIAWGGEYVNDFIDRGRTKKVYVQSAPQFRSVPANLSQLYFRNTNGDMVSFDSIGTYTWGFGPTQLERFNGVSSVQITGDPAPGISSGQAMQEMVRLINAHPGNYGYGWVGASYQEQLSGTQSQQLFALSALIVFLCLAALYESWSIPLSVMLIIPVGVTGALLAVLLRSMSNDVYLQVGLLTTGGLAAKNAILIVEYAHHYREQGMTILASARKAAAMRFRPIIMTSVAFLLGVLPLAVADGAGAQSQQSIGTGVTGGTIAATTLGLIMVPAFFALVSLLFDRKLRARLRRDRQRR